MFDSCRRDIHYLRLSVTDRCNLRCRYCMPDGAKILEHEEVLTHEEFLRLAALFAQCGIDTVRVTGGEPLVRKRVAQLVAGLKATPGIRHVSMTTNGTLLAQQLPALLDAGLDSVNISLDTLDPAVFRHITARDEFAAVQAGLRAALESLLPVKLNCVPQVGVNEGELEAIAALARDNDLQVPPDNAEALAKAQPRARKAIIAGMTHPLKKCTGRMRIDQTGAYGDSTLPIDPDLVAVVTQFIRGL